MNDTEDKPAAIDRRAVLGAGTAALAAAALAPARTGAAPVSGPGEASKKMQKELTAGAGLFPPPGPDDRSCDPRTYMKDLSNWGRWGKDDVVGTLNHITPAIRATAAKLVREGVSVGVGWKIKGSLMGGGMQRYMALMPNDFGGGGLGSEHLSEIAEQIIITSHAGWVTHLDALNHLYYDRKMYNGFPASGVTGIGGAATGEVAVLETGILSRGVLLDIPALLGVKTLEPGYTVKPEQLEAAEKRQNVSVREGDILLMRTGLDTRVRELGRGLSYMEGTPGWHPRCMPWLQERKVAVIGTDGGQEAYPTSFAWSGEIAPIHTVGIVAMGLWLIDWCNLEPLAAKCAELKRYEFMLSIDPLRLAGCSASPVQPIATF